MRRSAVSLALLAVLASACSSPEAGSPVPEGDQGEPTTGAPTTTASSATAEPLPERPEALPIDAVNPCDLITDAQRAELKVVRARETKEDTEAECALTVETDSRNIDVRIVSDTREGVDAWLKGDRNVDAEVATIEGYGAARFWLKGTKGSDCSTAIDVADGQNLQVGLLIPGQQWTREKLCETTDRFAAAALATLRVG
ncbi:DUF3558 domain-containing protein [Actinokineospora guangxiensis]|uniref:DUF3558 domain-containing protein n=1 Tax=Actinokineospora guangxiensis TaxID=1490288 RepID=A0ABW0EJG7_9PSEU